MNEERDMGLCGEPNCEEYWIECRVCGCEFCSKCFPGSRLCPTCAEAATLDDPDDEDGAGEPDFEDVPNLKAIMNDLDDPIDEPGAPPR